MAAVGCGTFGVCSAEPSDLFRSGGLTASVLSLFHLRSLAGYCSGGALLAP